VLAEADSSSINDFRFVFLYSYDLVLHGLSTCESLKETDDDNLLSKLLFGELRQRHLHADQEEVTVIQRMMWTFDLHSENAFDWLTFERNHLCTWQTDAGRMQQMADNQVQISFEQYEAIWLTLKDKKIVFIDAYDLRQLIVCEVIRRLWDRLEANETARSALFNIKVTLPIASGPFLNFLRFKKCDQIEINLNRFRVQLCVKWAKKCRYRCSYRLPINF
jgi:hypothetical protein